MNFWKASVVLSQYTVSFVHRQAIFLFVYCSLAYSMQKKGWFSVSLGKCNVHSVPSACFCLESHATSGSSFLTKRRAPSPGGPVRLLLRRDLYSVLCPNRMLSGPDALRWQRVAKKHDPLEESSGGKWYAPILTSTARLPKTQQLICTHALFWTTSVGTPLFFLWSQ